LLTYSSGFLEVEFFDEEFSALLITAISASLPCDFYFFKSFNLLQFSAVQLLYTVKEKKGKPDRKLYPLPYGLRNPYRNLKSENSQDYAQKPQRNCMFEFGVRTSDQVDSESELHS
jgi:hypothetical protein